MKKLALAVTVLAFGALMVAGCPQDNTKANTKKDDNSAKECGGDEACGDGEEACGDGE